MLLATVNYIHLKIPSKVQYVSVMHRYHFSLVDPIPILLDKNGRYLADTNNFLGAITTQHQTQWIMELRVDNVPVNFKIDTGAEVSAISKATFNHLYNAKL